MAEVVQSGAAPPWIALRPGPILAVNYQATELWVSSYARAAAGGWLKNEGLEAARRVAITDLVVDATLRCRFRPFGHLEPGDAVPIDPVFCHTSGSRRAEETTLAAVISRSVVRRVLAGRRLRTRWRLRVTCEDTHGRPSVATSEIELVNLPLTIRIRS